MTAGQIPESLHFSTNKKITQYQPIELGLKYMQPGAQCQKLSDLYQIPSLQKNLQKFM